MKTLIIDSNYFCYRSHYSRGEAKMVFDDERTDVIFGFLTDIRELGAKFSTNQFIFCWDSKSSKRKEICPGYKDRNKNLTDIQIADLRKSYEQFDLLRMEILPSIGFMNQVQAEGYEADDLIAKAVELNIDPIICSTDHDLYQLLDKSPIFNPATKSMYTIHSFKEEFGVLPDKWPVIKSVAGCTSDNVQGIAGVGEKGIALYLSGKMKPSIKKYTLIKEGLESITKQNLPLVSLPFPGTPSITIFKNKPLQESYVNFIEVCRRYGFNSFLRSDNLYLWKNFLNGFGFNTALEIATRISKKRTYRKEQKLGII